jgi:ABC-type uncharacterized transport system substrate-binding protein
MRRFGKLPVIKARRLGRDDYAKACGQLRVLFLEAAGTPFPPLRLLAGLLSVSKAAVSSSVVRMRPRMITRRSFLIRMSASFCPFTAWAQERSKIPRVGILLPEPLPFPSYESFREGLSKLGHVEGQTILLLPRWADGRQIEHFKPLASELVRLPVDIIVAGYTPAAIAAKEATNTIPIVLTATGDPVGLGFADSLARPGHNMTGMSIVTDELSGKRLALIKEIVPTASRIALLFGDLDVYRKLANGFEAPTRTLGLQLQHLEVRGPNDFESAFEMAKRGQADAMVLVQYALFAVNNKTLAELSIRHRLPVLSGEVGFAAAGGLINHGPNIRDSWRRAANYVDKILKGAKPGDLPIERPTKFAVVINLRTAKALGVTIPPEVLVQADEVIE